jgi:hypothetical protein
MDVIATPALSVFLHRPQPQRQQRDVRNCLRNCSAPPSLRKNEEEISVPPVAHRGAHTEEQGEPLTLVIPRHAFDSLVKATERGTHQAIELGILHAVGGGLREILYRRAVPVSEGPITGPTRLLVSFSIGGPPPSRPECDHAIGGAVSLNPHTGHVSGVFGASPVSQIWLPGPGLFTFIATDRVVSETGRMDPRPTSRAVSQIASMGADPWLRLESVRILIVGRNAAADSLEAGLREMGLYRIARVPSSLTKQHAGQCEILVTADVGRDVLDRCAVFSVAYELIHLDISFQNRPRRAADMPRTPTGVETRLFLPGLGCALCPSAGGRTSRTNGSEEGQIQTALPAPVCGPSESLLGVGCAMALQLLVGLADETVTGSRASHAYVEEGQFRVEALPVWAYPCSLCRQAGIGDLGTP